MKILAAGCIHSNSTLIDSLAEQAEKENVDLVVLAGDLTLGERSTDNILGPFVKRGKKVQVERKFMPGYVLAKLAMNDDIYHLIKNTPKVTGFLGSMGKPQPISESEAARYFGARKEAEAAPKHKVSVDYEIGDAVKVLDGPFASFNGTVEELDFEKNRVKVSVSIFGRATPVELDFEQVELSK